MKKSLRLGVLVALCLAMLPAVAIAAPPEPQGSVVFSDDYSDAAASGLPDNLQATDFSRGFHAPGVYHLLMRRVNDEGWVTYPNQTYGAFTMEADVADFSDTFSGDAWGGIVFRATDADHGYAFVFNSRSGEYAALKLDGGTWSELYPWTRSSLIRANDGVNHLRVDAAGTTFSLYINDEAVGTFDDSAYSEGGIGFVAGNVDAAEPHLHYDNLEVYAQQAMAMVTPTAATDPSTNTGGSTGSTGPLPTTGQPHEDWLWFVLAGGVLLLGAGVATRRIRTNSTDV